jgi:hypothetical protein
MSRQAVRIGVALLLAVATVAGVGLYYLVRQADEAIRDAYSVEWVAGMIIEYLESHGGDWPRGWDDLREPYEASVRKAGSRPWTFDELRSLVDVDWQADPGRLAEALPVTEGRPFRVVWLRDGRDVSSRGTEPNRMIYDYLRVHQIKRGGR